MDGKEIITQFIIPDICMRANYTGFNSNMSSDLAIKNELKTWCKENFKSGNRKTISNEVGLEFFNYCFPLAKEKELTILIAKFYTFAYVFDDEESVSNLEKIDKYMQIFEGKVEGITEPERLMAYFGKEFRLKLSPSFFSRLEMGIQEWFTSLKDERRMTFKSDKKGIDDYLRYREANAAALMVVATGEALLQIDCSSFINEEYATSIFHAACSHLIIVNDLYSFRKEYYSEDFKLNILYILYENHDSFQGAVDNCCDLIKKFEVDFFSYCDIALKVCRPAVRDSLSLWIKLLSDMMRGNILYSQSTPRYHGKTNKQMINNGLILIDPNQTLFTPC